MQPADPQLRSLQVLQDADGAARLFLSSRRDLDIPPVLLLGSMAEVQAEDIGACLEKAGMTAGIAGCGPRVATILAQRARLMN